jgi:tetratricopeptide (TPR) repeat protein
MSGARVSDLLVRGREALEAGEWQEAAAAFDEVLQHHDDPDAHDGLGTALWWLRDVDRAIAEREAAFASLRRAGEDRRAVSLALWLAREYQDALGNEPVSRGWLARAEGIVRELPDGPERGWLAL